MLRAYLDLVKFRYHLNFLAVIFAALIFAREIDGPLFVSLLQLYISFNVLFYTGIYTLNDLRDLKSDSLHPLKRNRPLPSGRVSVAAAGVLSALLILAGLITAFAVFGVAVVEVYCAALILNMFYSFFARGVPYLELVVNSSTHPLRFLLGVLLTGQTIPILHLAAYFAFIFGLVCFRREVEKDITGWEARHTLKVYTGDGLALLELVSFVFLIWFAIIDGFVSKGFYAALIGTYLALMQSGRYSVRVRRYLHAIWLN
jgi:4-hydroxybenzoate polyprenyltransferase